MIREITMRCKENIRILNSFIDKLQDTESEQLFDARFSYFVDRDKDSFTGGWMKYFRSGNRNLIAAGWISIMEDIRKTGRRALSFSAQVKWVN